MCFKNLFSYIVQIFSKWPYKADFIIDAVAQVSDVAYGPLVWKLSWSLFKPNLNSACYSNKH